MNFSSLSIKNPVPAILLFAMLTLAGLLTFRMSDIQNFPDIELPIVMVSANLSGAAPATLETQVARKLENSIASIAKIKKIYTTILDGSVSISIEFELEKNANEAETEVRAAVAKVRADLPADMVDPVVSVVSTAGRPVSSYALSSSSMDEEALSWLIDDTITKRMLAIKGVGSVHRLGGVTREVKIALDPVRMTALNVSAADVSKQLRKVQMETPGGHGQLSGGEQSVRTIATVASAAELGGLQLPLTDGRSIRLEQVATISDTIAERTSRALLNGKPVVAFEVSRSKGASEITINQAVEAAVAELKAKYPNIHFDLGYENVSPVQDNYEGSMHLLYEGAILAVIVVWWFLRDWRATLVAAVALPLSVIPTFLGMYLFGFSINIVTLLSLALVVGILVDDAIVEIENISRHLAMGKSPYRAAMEAADEIGMAVVATTFALVAVFLPTAFMSGVVGKFFKQFGWTAVLSILASLLVARLITPMMAAYLLKPKPHVVHKDSKLMQRYLVAMKWSLNHRFITLIASVAFFVGSLMLIPLLPTGFVPAGDTAQTMVSVELPPGSTLDETYVMAEKVRARLGEIKELTTVLTSVGGGSSGDAFTPGTAADIRKAVMTVTMVTRNERPMKQQVVEESIRQKLADIPGVRLTVGSADTGTKLIMVLKSDDPLALKQAAQAVERDLRTLKGVGNISSSASLIRPEIIIRPDFARAADMGVTAESIGDTVRVATAGDYDVALAKLNLPQRQVPVRVELEKTTRTDIDAIGRLLVPGKNGPVMLSNVADLSLDSGSAEIGRLDRSRKVTLEVELGSRQLGEVYAEALALPSMKQLPPGVTLADSGDAAEMQALFGNFGLAMGVGVLCIYVVLVLLFHSFTQPLSILVALPFSIGGAFIALLITGSSFSMPSLIGLLMLMGIVTKNSILLVEYAIEARRGHELDDDGNPVAPMSRFDALVDACHKRARPIIMTSIAMAAGMLPIAMGIGSDPSFRGPMAIAVIGGIFSSTLLSLLVVPAFYTYVDDLESLISRTINRFRSAPVAEEIAAK